MINDNIYNVGVLPPVISNNTFNGGSATITGFSSDSSTLGFTSYWGDNCWSHSYWPHTSTVYMYELKCPRCATKNWGQLDIITPCKKCTAKLKAVSQEVDFEIPVG